MVSAISNVDIAAEHNSVVAGVSEGARRAGLNVVEVSGSAGAVDDEVSLVSREIASAGSHVGDGSGVRSVVEVHLNVGAVAHRNAALACAVRHSSLCGVGVSKNGDDHKGHDRNEVLKHENISFPLPFREANFWVFDLDFICSKGFFFNFRGTA